MLLKDVLEFYSDEAEYIESIAYDGSEDEFKLDICVQDDDFVNTCELYLYTDDVGIFNIKSYDKEDHEDSTCVSSKFIKVLYNIINKWDTVWKWINLGRLYDNE